MDWSTYYERFYDWADSTQVSRISTIDEFGDVSDEITEVVQSLLDSKACTRLIKRALSHGVRFTASEIEELIPNLDSVPDGLLLTCKTPFTQDQIDSIAFYYDNQTIIEQITRQSGLKKHDDNHIEQYNKTIRVSITNVHKPKPPKSSFGLILRALGMGLFRGIFGSQKSNHPGVCNGDCANCPPHFGYRYGRWYYGHGHNYGCEFGGNRGGGNS